ncbi:hypothetical protein ACQ86O_21115 [Serratia sp. L9]|uniref:hypothetical protein n=1 Tax=Serratia sp. L9 TaxID=3423946 RepID=UPI003D6644DC
MQLNPCALLLGAGLLMLTGVVNAGPSNQVPKTTHLTAKINHALFVSKPDGASWYDVKEVKPLGSIPG